jgi:hypothetical protein
MGLLGYGMDNSAEKYPFVRRQSRENCLWKLPGNKHAGFQMEKISLKPLKFWPNLAQERVSDETFLKKRNKINRFTMEGDSWGILRN